MCVWSAGGAYPVIMVMTHSVIVQYMYMYHNSPLQQFTSLTLSVLITIINSFSANHNNRGHLNHYNESRFKFSRRNLYNKYQHAYSLKSVVPKREKTVQADSFPPYALRWGKLSTQSQTQHWKTHFFPTQCSLMYKMLSTKTFCLFSALFVKKYMKFVWQTMQNTLGQQFSLSYCGCLVLIAWQRKLLTQSDHG